MKKPGEIEVDGIILPPVRQRLAKGYLRKWQHVGAVATVITAALKAKLLRPGDTLDAAWVIAAAAQNGTQINRHTAGDAIGGHGLGLRLIRKGADGLFLMPNAMSTVEGDCVMTEPIYCDDLNGMLNEVRAEEEQADPAVEPEEQPIGPTVEALRNVIDHFWHDEAVEEHRDGIFQDLIAVLPLAGGKPMWGEDADGGRAVVNYEWGYVSLFDAHPECCIPQWYEKAHIEKFAGRSITDEEFAAFRSWLLWKTNIDERIEEVVAPLVDYFFDEKGGVY